MPRMPEILLQKLGRLAQHERRLRLVWGIARIVAITVSLFLIFTGIDWLIDLWRDTPGWLRWCMRLTVAGTLGWLTWQWLIKPWNQGLSSNELALWVESQDARYGHSLVTAVQLNAPQANQSGMSKELIAKVTRNAETMAEHADFTELLDQRRWRWSGALLLPAFLIPLALWFKWPETTAILWQRFMGLNQPIPRSVHLLNITPTLQPSGEPATLTYLVTGNWSQEMAGTVEIRPEGQASETYPLRFHTVTSEGALFTTSLPASSTSFTHDAWLHDGRTQESGEINFVPRPVLTSWEASLLLPRYVGLRPDGSPYELPQPKGDLKPVPGSIARIQVSTPTPIAEAYAELLAPFLPELGAQLALPIGPVSVPFLLNAEQSLGWTPSAAGPLLPLARIPLTIAPDGLSASAQVALPSQAAAYRIVVTDKHGLTNRPIPRRSISFHPDEVPVITLLPERFSQPSEGTEEIDLDGMPVPLGRSIRISYLVRDDLAIDSVVFRYRINEGPWEQLPLTEAAEAKEGTFDFKTGALVSSQPKDQIAFHTVQPADPARELGRVQGGGRFDFQTRSIPQLKLGDTLEYYLEARDRHADPDRNLGRSVVRRKSIVTESQFIDWMVNVVQQESRLRQVEKQQRKVFEPR